MHSPHRALGLACPCTKTQLKAARRRLALSTHPDKGGSNAAFVAVQEAYEAVLQQDTWADELPQIKQHVEEWRSIGGFAVPADYSRVHEWQEDAEESVEVECINSDEEEHDEYDDEEEYDGGMWYAYSK